MGTIDKLVIIIPIIGGAIARLHNNISIRQNEDFIR